MRLRRVSIVTALVLAGCDTFHGIQSHAALPGPVDIACVNAALSSVADAGRVTYQRSESHATEILPKQRRVRTVAHVWIYGEGRKYVLQINETADGWDYRNGRVQMNRAVTQDDIDLFVPLMTRVNREIETRCGVPVAELALDRLGAARALSR